MITCRQCGHQNPNGTTWCQSPGCGAFLEFEGEKQPTGIIPPVSTGPTSGPAAPPDATTPGPGRGEPLLARPPATASADRQAPPRQPTAQPPATAAPPPPPQQATNIPPIRPGEIVCPMCGWGNEPTRTFCRHDGAVLRGAAAGPQQPMKVGQRQRSSHGGWPWLLIVALVAAVVVFAGGGFLGYRYFTHKGPDVHKAKPTPSPVAVRAVRAVSIDGFTSQSGAKLAKNTIDGDRTTFWSAAYPSGIPGNPRPDIDRRPKITYKFDPAVRLVRVDILNGAAGPDFALRPRAKRIFLRFSDGTLKEVTLLDDGTKFQPVQIKLPKPVSSMELRISTSYPGSATDDNRYRFSIAEVTFFTAR